MQSIKSICLFLTALSYTKGEDAVNTPRFKNGTLERTAFVRGMNARTILLSKEAHWTEVTSIDDATLVWLRNHKRRSKPFESDPETQIYNRLPASSQMTDKAKMFANVNSYEVDNGVLGDSCLPRTFSLRTEADVLDLENHYDELSQGAWILKPTKESMGVGITIHTNNTEWWKGGELAVVKRRVRSGSPYVLQKYIKNPLLLNGRKSELRLYWVVLSLSPLVAAIYEHGQVRINSMPYEYGDFKNPLKHLTNIHQQRKHPDFKRLSNSGELKWSLESFMNYTINSLGYSEDRIRKTLWQNMKHCVVRTLNATAEKLRGDHPQGGRGRFELVGTDFILDSDLNVFLTEVQQGPGLAINDPVKARVLRPALTNAANLALDIQNILLAKQPVGNLSLEGTGYEYLVHEGLTPPYYLHYDGER
eukprot:TRINITY_DN4270_c0_g2_i1.p1 TRINITY_DN4270_c0_g2~~TRINITY_DN4270_c0_g2_i1.p1  ORF type:complete len:449 (+),score=85.53 TRINITY_DN4270_c0_g2_i1:88-1347(+)